MSYYPEPPRDNVLRKWAMGVVLVVMALWVLASAGCAATPACERAPWPRVKNGVVLECSLGRDQYGHPAKVCLVLKPGGRTATTVVQSCR